MSLAAAGTLGGAQAPRPLGVFDGHTDVGRVRRAGTVQYDDTTQRYHAAGSGQDMWSARDAFHVVWRRMTGDFILSTRARLVGRGVEPHRRIGWSIRPTLDAGAPHATTALHGAATEQVVAPDSLRDLDAIDAIVRLERRGGAYIMSVARHDDTLVTRRLDDVSLPDSVYVGLHVCAHNDTVVERATFRNVRITIPARAGFRPYRDYLGSRLEILDVASGDATVVHTGPGSFQAPNRTPDGRALVYAQDGRLRLMPIGGGPARVLAYVYGGQGTITVPSWSPDGTRLAFVSHTGR